MARKDLTEIVVLDLEATCWETREEQGSQPQEIIEVGISRLPLVNLEPIREAEIIVKPRWSKVSDFCTGLTTLTQEDVDKGIDVSEALDMLWKRYGTGSKMVACWGTWDFEHIHRETKSKELQNPIGSLRMDVKSFYSMVKGMTKGVGMMTALDQLGIEHEGTHHRGDDDALNIARVLAKLLKGSRESLY